MIFTRKTYVSLASQKQTKKRSGKKQVNEGNNETYLTPVSQTGFH